MRLNDNLSEPTVAHAAAMDWIPSPAKGVERRMLFRIGAEKARATSIVRYAADSHFARHGHPGGEEFLVLEGVFQDETGDFPAGTYVRNPPGTGHAPRSGAGCVIFVKLWQFRADDQRRVVQRPCDDSAALTGPDVISSRLLFENADERVVIAAWAPRAEIVLPNATGLELLVLDGSTHDEGRNLDRWSWFRLPVGVPFRAQAGAEGAQVWYKQAPLLHDAVVQLDTGETLQA